MYSRCARASDSSRCLNGQYKNGSSQSGESRVQSPPVDPAVKSHRPPAATSRERWRAIRCASALEGPSISRTSTGGQESDPNAPGHGLGVRSWLTFLAKRRDKHHQSGTGVPPRNSSLVIANACTKRRSLEMGCRIASDQLRSDFATGILCLARDLRVARQVV